VVWEKWFEKSGSRIVIWEKWFERSGWPENKVDLYYWCSVCHYAIDTMTAPSLYRFDAIYKCGCLLYCYFSWYRHEVENTTPQLTTNKELKIQMSTPRNTCRPLDRNPNNLNLSKAQKYQHHTNYNPPFFWFEISGWPEKKIQVCRTTFLEPLF
jgi:hypothetical protein